MELFRVALANLRVSKDRDESVELAAAAIGEAGAKGARLVAFPECFVPGYRAKGTEAPPPDVGFLERAWKKLAEASARANVTSVIGTERIVDGALHASVVVID